LLERFRSKENDPVVAMVLNLLGFGAIGYVYLGQTQKALVAAVLWLIAAIPTCLWGGCVVALIAAIDAYKQAERIQLATRRSAESTSPQPR
jgi:TM2 domain-containing membrane protein YozV